MNAWAALNPGPGAVAPRWATFPNTARRTTLARTAGSQPTYRCRSNGNPVVRDAAIACGLATSSAWHR